MATDLERACSVSGAACAPLYFTRALNVCDGVRGMSTGGRLLGALGNGCINDLDKMLEYRGGSCFYPCIMYLLTYWRRSCNS